MASMRLTLTTLTDAVYQLEVSSDLELENFKALCEVESGIPAAEISLLHNGRPLYDDKKPLKEYGIVDGDMLMIQQLRGGGRGGFGGSTSSRVPPVLPSSSSSPFNLDFSSIQIPGVAPTSSSAASSSRQRPPAAASSASHEMTAAEQQRILNDPVKLREALLSRPEEVALLKERNPPLADALLSGDLERFTRVLRDQQKEREDREAEKIRMLNADPFDPDVQAKIAEEIRLRNVETNMETAMEYAPESFGQVTMLYIDCRVNGHPVKAFVDSGAQMTIMSVNCAERCNIGRLVDRRWAGVAKGVGTQKIIGRVHLGQIQIGKDFLQSSFSILEDQPMDMLLGLDMLKRHQCCIDLKNNRLIIGTTGTETPFLSESDLPSCARLTSGGAEGGALDPTGAGGAPMDEDEALAKALQNSADDAAAAAASRGTGNDTNNSSSSGGVETQPKRQAMESSSSSSSATSTKPLDSGATPAVTAPSSTPSGGGSSGGSGGINEADLNQLIAMGFDRNDAETQLRLHRGDVNQAIAALIARSLKF